MKFNVIIEIKNEALLENTNQELARILTDVAAVMADHGLDWPGGPDIRLYDSNGNKVGRAFVSGKRST